MPVKDPGERALLARIAIHARWAKTDDRSAATAPARRAFRDRFEKQVDPEGVLPPAERAKRADSARKAFYLKLAYKSAAARRKAKEHTALAEAAERELAALPDLDGR